MATIKQIKARYAKQRAEIRKELGVSWKNLKKTDEYKRIRHNELNALWKRREKTTNKPSSDPSKYSKSFNIARNQPYFMALNYGYNDIEEIVTRQKKGGAYPDFTPIGMMQFYNARKGILRLTRKKAAKFRAIVKAPDFGFKDVSTGDFGEFQKAVKDVYLACRKFQGKDGSDKISLVDTTVGIYNGIDVLLIEVKKPNRGSIFGMDNEDGDFDEDNEFDY